MLHAMMRANPLAALVTMDEAGPVANHIPMQLLSEPEPHGLLLGHIARANPLWREHQEGQPALALFQGPNTYVSPSLYPSKSISGEVVPTWDYAVVHAHGTLRFIHDPHWLLGLVSKLTDAHEARRPTPWAVGDAPARYVETMLKAIVGFEFSINRISGKWKVSQNRNAADRAGVMNGLRAAGDASSLEIAEMLSTRGADTAGA